MQEIQKKLERICQLLSIQNDDDIIKAHVNAYTHNLKHIICIKVQPNYYDLDLEGRRLLAGSCCQNINQLTKCLFYENKAAPIDDRDPANSRYYLIIYQYIRKFSQPKLHIWVRNMKNENDKFKNLTKQNYSYNFVDEQVAATLCDASYNGMSPIGLKDLTIPVIIDQHITEEYIFVGGLHPLVKVKVSIKDLIQNFNSFKVPVTDPLTPNQ